MRPAAKITPTVEILKNKSHPLLLTHQHQRLFTFQTLTKRTPDEEQLISPICNLLRRGGNWDSLTKTFNSIHLSDPIVEKVLLELKETTDAKHALKFFHWSAQSRHTTTTNRTEHYHGIRSYCITIHILVRARLLTDARVLLESIITRTGIAFSVAEMLVTTYNVASSTPLVFNLLVQTYSKLRMLETAFDACRYLEENGYSCSVISYNSLMHLIQKSASSSLVWKVYEYMISMRKYPNEITVRILISALCKEGSLQKVVDVLGRIHGKRCSPVVIVNTSLVLAVLEEGRLDEGLALLKRMLLKNLILDDVAYSLTIFAKYKMNHNLESAQALYDEMLERGFRANAFIYTLFIGGYCKEGRIEEAMDLMREMEAMDLKPYDETFNVLVEGCAVAGRLEDSLKFCEEMAEGGFLPSCCAYNKMVRELGETWEMKRANDILTVLLDKGFQPNEATYSYLMDGYGKLGETQQVLKLYHEMEYKKHFPGIMAYTSLIRSLCQCGKLDQAERYITVMEDRSVSPTVVIYELLVAEYHKAGNATKALQIYKVMLMKELKPSCQSFVELVQRFNNAGYVKEEYKVVDG